MKNPRFSPFAAVCAAALCAAPAAHAQTFPSKPIHFVVDYPPGGVPDIIARTMGQKLAEAVGQPVVVDNRPGAGGQVAIDFVAGSQADGYTLMLGQTGSYAIAPHLLRRGDLFEKSLTPVALAATAPVFLVANAKLGVSSVAELVALAKAKPGLPYGSSGNGSGHHLAMELFKTMTRTEMSHIPYKGAAQTTLAVASGEVGVAFLGLNNAEPQAKSGNVRILGVATPQRNAVLTEVPTIAEAGVPGYAISITLGFFAPRGTPPDVIDRLNAEFAKVVRMPEVRQKLSPLGIEAADGGTTPAQYAALIRDEYATYGKIVRAANLKVD